MAKHNYFQRTRLVVFIQNQMVMCLFLCIYLRELRNLKNVYSLCLYQHRYVLNVQEHMLNEVPKNRTFCEQ